MLLTDQRFCITPPYRTARPGRLIRPTNVAAVICHALSPAFSQLGYAAQLPNVPPFPTFGWSAVRHRGPPPRTDWYESRATQGRVGPSWPTLPGGVSTFV